MAEAAHDKLAQLESEIKSNLTTPRPDTLSFLTGAVARLREIPFSIEPERRVECLLNIVQQFYHQGQSMFDGVEPAALAVMIAGDLGNAALHRKSLTFQGIILSQTNNPGDALLSLAGALRLAESLDDGAGIAIVWNSLGGAFYDAALYLDARQCYERASALSIDRIDLRHVRSAALANAAMCCLHRHEYTEGIEKVLEAIASMPAPDSPPLLLARVLAEGTYTRLLLATGNIKGASERVQLSKEFAAAARSVRADISAACSEGLVEVYSGLADIGL